jgi:outer membrane protein
VIPALSLAVLLAAAPAPAAPAAPAARVLTLDEALSIGRARQPQLRQARAATEAARGRVDQSLAPLLPQLNGSAKWQRSSGRAGDAFALPTTPTVVGAGGTTFVPSSGATELYSLNLTGSLLLWDFGQTWDRWRASQASARSQGESERAAAELVDLNIRANYFNAVAMKALVGVSRDALDNEAKHLDQIRNFVEVGTRPPIDLVTERANYANARVKLIQAENSYATARVQVEQAIGAPDLGPWDVADTGLPPVAGEEASLDVLLDEAVKARPELAALAEQIRAQELTVRAIQGAYGPSLGISAGVSDTRGNFTDTSNTIWTSTATLTWPLFQGGQTRGQVREARASVSSLEAQLEQERQQVRVDVEQARLGVRAAIATLSASEEASQAARERLTLAEGRYETGVGSLLDLSDAQLGLTTALGQQVQARFQLAAARSQLLKALGRP